MWVVWKKLDNFDLLAPTAWFNLEKNARDYAEYLSTLGICNDVVYAPDQHIEGDDVSPMSLIG